MSLLKARKQKANHPEITAKDYALAQDVLDNPTRQVKDGIRSMIFVKEDAVGGYVAIVKATKVGEGLFVTSYRKLSREESERDREVRRLLRKSKE